MNRDNKLYTKVNGRFLEISGSTEDFGKLKSEVRDLRYERDSLKGATRVIIFLVKNQIEWGVKNKLLGIDSHHVYIPFELLDEFVDMIGEDYLSSCVEYFKFESGHVIFDLEQMLEHVDIIPSHIFRPNLPNQTVKRPLNGIKEGSKYSEDYINYFKQHEIEYNKSFNSDGVLDDVFALVDFRKLNSFFNLIGDVHLSNPNIAYMVACGYVAFDMKDILKTNGIKLTDVFNFEYEK